ncbi:MAG TPA: type 4a pilus biogenesis protein PilO [Syntrophothermus lipocalidus]|nr:type 4a pilus biogenesis protein PilO [Syntrophothermus lipocalidus]
MAALLKRRLFSLGFAEQWKLRLIFAILLSFLGLWAAYKWYFHPHLNNINRLKTEQAEMGKAVARAEKERWDDIQGMQKDIAGLDEKLAELREVVPDYQDLPGVTIYISGLAEKCGVKPAWKGDRKSGIKIEKPVSRSGYTTYDLKLNIYGSPYQVYAFLKGIEEMPRLVQIENLQLEVSAWDNVLCSLTVRVFVLGRPQKDPENSPFMNFILPKSWPYEMLKPSVLEQANSQGSATAAPPSPVSTGEETGSGYPGPSTEISNPK